MAKSVWTTCSLYRYTSWVCNILPIKHAYYVNCLLIATVSIQMPHSTIQKFIQWRITADLNTLLKTVCSCLSTVLIRIQYNIFTSGWCIEFARQMILVGSTELIDSSENHENSKEIKRIDNNSIYLFRIWNSLISN